MTAFIASYYDGRNAAETPVSVTVDKAGLITINGVGLSLEVPVGQTRWSDRMGRTRRFVSLPAGAMLELDDNEAADTVVARFGVGRRVHWVHVLERSWAHALGAVVVTAILIWAGLTFAVPALSQQIASQIPIELESQMGEEAMNVLDSHFLAPSGLSVLDRKRVERLFARLRQGHQPLRLELRAAPTLGANAFALPSGIMVVTDELVELSESDEELLAVMAHEVGHVYHRHIMRAVIQNSATALLLATLVGDLSSVAGLSATIPTFLMEAKHSREYELEADHFAANLLSQQNLDPRALGRILRRLTQERSSGAEGPLWRYLSSHPATEERIDAIERLYD